MRRYGNIIKLISAKTEYGRLAQLVEHLLDVQILYEKGFGYVFCLQEVLRKDYTER